MSPSTLGEVRIFAGTVLPQSWAYCDGAEVRLSSNTALYALLGYQFGGDGIRSFALPKLADAGPGLRYIICTDGDFQSMAGHLGEIRLYAGQERLIPPGWARCKGQSLPIGSRDYLGLFAILGARFGGNGETQFELPRLADPFPGVHYIICIQGGMPEAAPRT